MEMSPMLKWQRSIERSKKSREKQKQRRQDVQDLKNAGVWQSPDELYLDEYGQVKPDAPTWYRNLSKAWDSNRSIHTVNRELKSRGLQPAKRKRKKKTMDLKTRKVKIKRSVQMKALLENNGVSVSTNGTIESYEDFTFLPNGRIKTPEKDVISAIQFLSDYV